MTDYSEEQVNEMEALQSIYPTEFKVVAAEPYHSFTISINSDDYGEEAENGAALNMQITYVENYPDAPPVIEVQDPENLEDEDVKALTELLESEASNNIGMVMVFVLVSAAQEWLNGRSERMAQQRIEQQEKEKRDEEEAEMKKFEGTRVSVETFLRWKAKFDAEIAAMKKMIEKEEQGTKKLTGRELFERDQSMNESDIQFLSQQDDEIEVDESLFQEYEDLM